MVPKFLNAQNLNHPNIFPDENFRTQIANKLNKQPDERFTRLELLSITEIDIRYVQDITGIRMSSNLERLSLTY